MGVFGFNETCRPFVYNSLHGGATVRKGFAREPKSLPEARKMLQAVAGRAKLQLWRAAVADEAGVAWPLPLVARQQPCHKVTALYPNVSKPPEKVCRKRDAACLPVCRVRKRVKKQARVRRALLVARLRAQRVPKKAKPAVMQLLAQKFPRRLQQRANKRLRRHKPHMKEMSSVLPPKVRPFRVDV